MWTILRPPVDRSKRYKYICAHPHLLHTERFVNMSCVIPMQGNSRRFFIVGKRSGRAYIVEEIVNDPESVYYRSAE